MKKRTFLMITIVTVLALLAFGLSGCGSSNTTEPESAEPIQEETKDASAWYASILEDASTQKEYPYYRLLDMDGDGTDELFLSSTEKAFIGAKDKVKLMALVDGEATLLKEIGGTAGESFSYDEEDRSLFYFSRLSGEKHIVKYKFEKGKLAELQTSDEYDENHDPETGNNIDDTYYLDGKKVTEAKADVLWDQFDDKAKALTYSKDGKGIPNADDDADEPDDDDD